MQPALLSQWFAQMITKILPDSDLTKQVKAALAKEPGLSVKDLAERLNVNRQFMSGYLAALKDRDELASRTVGPARIYFNVQ